MVYAKGELVAKVARHLWSWDITKLKGSTKWVYYYLYVILDVYSRYVVGWMIAECEQDGLASPVDCAQLSPRKHSSPATDLAHWQKP